MKVWLAAIMICFIIGLFFVTIDESLHIKKRHFINAQLSSQSLRLETAENSAEWYQGLSNRTQLCDNCGMIFLFPSLEQRSFVMRNMNFGLDIIWIKNGEVIGFEKSLAPEQEPYTPYRSPDAINTVLELPAGFIDKYTITVGSKLILL